ncbi:hypothetical protein AALB16_00070 [Lachnospiraceae bacterium 62-35]
MLKKRWGIVTLLILMSLFILGSSFQAMAKRKDDDDEEIEKEELDEISELWWDDNGEANWDMIEGAYQYEVTLYRNSSKVTTVKTKAEKYRFYSKMTREGEYTFRVRPLAKSKSKEYKDGRWSEYSETFDVDDDFADEARKNKKESNSSSTSSGSSPGEKIGWQQDNIGHWWRRSDGSYPKSEWMTIENKQYYFDQAGYRVTGWVEIEGKQCYFDVSGVYQPDGSSSKEASGEWKSDSRGRWWQRPDGSYPVNEWLELGGKWYFFEPSGYMKTGWVSWNGKWYYCQQDGSMAASTYVDGNYWVDADGVCDRR